MMPYQVIILLEMKNQKYVVDKTINRKHYLHDSHDGQDLQTSEIKKNNNDNFFKQKTINWVIEIENIKR